MPWYYQAATPLPSRARAVVQSLQAVSTGVLMVYQRSTTRLPGDRRNEYAIADDARALIREQNDALLDTGASKWRYSARQVPRTKSRASS